MNKLKNIVLKSDELIIKEINHSDITMEYVEWLNDKEVNQHLESRFIHQDLNTVSKFVDSCQKNKQVFLFGIFTIKSMKHIGNIKLGPINKRHKSAEIGIIIGDKNYWGKGFAKQAISVVIQFGFDQLNLKKIVAGCYENNFASKKAFEGSGFKVEGFLRSHVKSVNGREGVWRLGCIKSDLIL